MVTIRRGARAPKGSGVRGVRPELGKVTEEQLLGRVTSNDPRVNAYRSDQALAELRPQGQQVEANFPLMMQGAPNTSPVIGPAMEDRYRSALVSGQVNNPNLNRMIEMRDGLRQQYQSAPPEQRQQIAMRGKSLNMAIDQEVNRSAGNMMRSSNTAQRTILPVEDYYSPIAQQGLSPALTVQRPGGGQIQSSQTLDDVMADVALQQSRVAPGTVESLYTGSKNFDPMEAGLDQDAIMRYRQSVGLRGAQQANPQQQAQMYAMSQADQLRQFDIGNRDNAADTGAQLGQRDIDRPDFWTNDTQQPLGLREAPPNYMMVRDQYPDAPVMGTPGQQYLALAQREVGAPLPVVMKGGEPLAPDFTLSPSDFASVGQGGMPTPGMQYLQRVNPLIANSPAGGGARVMIGDRNQYVMPNESVSLGAVDLSTPGSVAFNRPVQPFAVPDTGKGSGRIWYENGVLMSHSPGDPTDVYPVNRASLRPDTNMIAALNQRTAGLEGYDNALGMMRQQYDFDAAPIRDEMGYVINPNNPDVMRRNPAGIGNPALVAQADLDAANYLDQAIAGSRYVRGQDMDVIPYQMAARRLNIQGNNLQADSMMAPALTESLAGGVAANQVQGGGRDYTMLEPVLPQVNPNEGMAAMAQQAKLNVLNAQRRTVGLPAIDPNAPEGAAIVNAALEAQHLSRVRKQAEPLRQKVYQRQMDINNAARTRYENELGAASPQIQRVQMLQRAYGVDEASANRLNNHLVGRGIVQRAGAPRELGQDAPDDYIMGLRQAMTMGGVRF